MQPTEQHAESIAGSSIHCKSVGVELQKVIQATKSQVRLAAGANGPRKNFEVLRHAAICFSTVGVEGGLEF